MIDFGVQGVEYWMVMEAGKMDLLAWRALMVTKPTNRYVNKEQNSDLIIFIYHTYIVKTLMIDIK